MIKKQPLLPLDHWRELIGFNPWHFWGWADNNFLQVTSSCNPVVTEYAWQSADAAGRADIAQAIQEVQRRLFDLLGYEFAPVWKEETLPWPRFVDRRMQRTGPFGADGRWLNVKLPDGFIQALGVETLDPISTNVAVTYTDADGDGLTEIATIGPIATTVTDSAEIALYVSAADRTVGLDRRIGDAWKIEPIVAQIANGQVTITANAWLFMKPTLREGLTYQTPVDPGVSTNFLSTIDVYRHYTNGDVVSVDSSQGVIIWETRPIHGWWCQCTSCIATDPTFSGSIYDPAATARAAARVGIRDAKGGQVIPAQAVYNTDTQTFEALDWSICMEPDRVTIRYRAGYPFDENGWVSPQWNMVVARYAAAELARPICGCENANRSLFYWQYDLAKIGNSKDLYNPPRATATNKLGTRRGHVYAWNQIDTLMNSGGTILL